MTTSTRRTRSASSKAVSESSLSPERGRPRTRSLSTSAAEEETPASPKASSSSPTSRGRASTNRSKTSSSSPRRGRSASREEDADVLATTTTTTTTTPKKRRGRSASKGEDSDATPRRRGRRSASKGNDDADATSEVANTTPTRSKTRQAGQSSVNSKDPPTDAALLEEDTGKPIGKEEESSAGKAKSESSRKKEKEPKKKKKKRDSRKSADESSEEAQETTPMEVDEDDKGGDDDLEANKKEDTTQKTPPPSSLSLLLPTKPDPPPIVVDVTVHRMRQVQYHPKPILCIAASPPYIATSRESGRVTLQLVSSKMPTLAEIAGSTNIPLTVLAWTKPTTTTTMESNNNNNNRPVLIGASRNEGALYVVDFWGTSQLTAKTPTAGGGIFCLQSLHNNNNSDLVAAGCQDGSIRIFRVVVVANNDTSHGGRDSCHYELQAVSTIPSAGAAVLSLACRQQQQGDDSSMVLFAGVADGTIRRYDCYTNTNSATAAGGTSATDRSFFAAAGVTWKSTLRMTVECYGRSTPTRVWALKMARDGTVISGDSLGHVQFWDGNTGTLISSFEQNDNKADVLDLDLSTDECMVFASGVDPRVVCIERSTADQNSSLSDKWVMTHAQRPHTHDIKAVTVVRNTVLTSDGRDKTIEILCTGGLDTKFCTYDVTRFAGRRPRTYYPWPALKSPIAVSDKGRLLTMLREDRVDFYELAAKQKDGDPNTQMISPVLVPEERHSLISSVQVQGSSNLSCSTISSDGQFLALSDSYAIVLFLLKKQQQQDGDGEGSATTIVPSRIPVKMPEASSSIVAMRFIEDTTLMVATSSDRILVISLSAKAEDDDNMQVDGAKPEYQAVVEQVLDLPVTNAYGPEESDSSCLLPVHSVIGSLDGKWFATLRNSGSERDGKIDIFCRSENDSSYRYWWTLPTLGNAVTAASFLATQDDSPQLFAVASIKFLVYVFNLSDRCLSEWSENAGYPITTKLPMDIAERIDYPVRIGINPGSPQTLMVGSFGAIVVFKMDEAFPLKCRVFPESHVRRAGKKRNRPRSLSEPIADVNESDVETEEGTTCVMCLRYNSMLHMGFLDSHEMVIVEQPWLSVVATFPAGLQRRLYGT